MSSKPTRGRSSENTAQLTSQRQLNSVSVRAANRNIDALLASQARELPLVVDTSTANNKSNVDGDADRDTKRMSPTRWDGGNAGSSNCSNRSSGVSVQWLPTPSLSELSAELHDRQSVGVDTSRRQQQQQQHYSVYSPPPPSSSLVVPRREAPLDGTSAPWDPTTSTATAPTPNVVAVSHGGDLSQYFPVSSALCSEEAFFPSFQQLQQQQQQEEQPQQHYFHPHGMLHPRPKKRFEETTPQHFLGIRGGAEHRGIDSISADKLSDAILDCPNREKREAAQQALAGTSLDRMSKIFNNNSFKKNSHVQQPVSNVSHRTGGGASSSVVGPAGGTYFVSATSSAPKPQEKKQESLPTDDASQTGKKNENTVNSADRLISELVYKKCSQQRSPPSLKPYQPDRSCFATTSSHAGAASEKNSDTTSLLLDTTLSPMSEVKKKRDHDDDNNDDDSSAQDHYQQHHGKKQIEVSPSKLYADSELDDALAAACRDLENRKPAAPPPTAAAAPVPAAANSNGQGSGFVHTLF